MGLSGFGFLISGFGAYIDDCAEPVSHEAGALINQARPILHLKISSASSAEGALQRRRVRHGGVVTIVCLSWISWDLFEWQVCKIKKPHHVKELPELP